MSDPDFADTSAASRCLCEGLAALSLSLAVQQRRSLLAFLAELRRWNRRFNLTSITEPVAMVRRHLLDCLSVLPFIDMQGGPILDLGTGAGLPGIVIATCRPHREVCMIDAVAKKVRFVTHAIAMLELANARAEHARSETYRLSALFDVVIARAVAEPPVVLARAQALLAPGGCCLVMSGVVRAAWWRAVDKNRWSIDVESLRVPGLVDRNLVVFRPISPIEGDS